MNIPGAALSHQIIRKQCRDNRGAAGAFEEAYTRIRLAYDALIRKGVSDDTEIHLVMVVQQDRHRQQADLAAVEQRYQELFCAVWECPPEEFDDTKHDEAVEEAHRQCREEFRLRNVERENAELRTALQPFAALFDGNLDQVGGGTHIAPTIKVQWVKDAKAALTPPTNAPNPESE